MGGLSAPLCGQRNKTSFVVFAIIFYFYVGYVYYKTAFLLGVYSKNIEIMSTTVTLQFIVGYTSFFYVKIGNYLQFSG